MTHFIGAVVVPPSVEFITNTTRTKYPDLYGADAKEWIAGTALNEFLERALAKFDENKEMPRYVEYTREQAIEKSRREVEEYRNGTYAEYLADPVKYAKGVSNEKHLEYLRTGFPQRLEWTDEQHYENVASWYDDENKDAEGNLYSTYNPHSKWDWWVIGGRWEQTYRERQGEKISALREELEKALANLRDPEAQAELAAVEAEIKEGWAVFNAQRARTQEWLAANPSLNAGNYAQNARLAHGGDPNFQVLTFEDTDKLEAKRLDCRAYLPWWFPYNVVVPTKVEQDPSESNEVTYDSDGNVEQVDDFEWITKGRMGWWGMHTDEFTDEQWVESLIKILDVQDPEARLVYIDFHI